MKEVKVLMKKVFLFSALLGVLAALAGFFIFNPAFGAGILLAVIISTVGIFFLASDVEKILSGKHHSFFMFRFIFRLACFAILLYLLLVRLKLSPVGIIAGFVIPLLCMTVIFLFSARKDMQNNGLTKDSNIK